MNELSKFMKENGLKNEDICKILDVSHSTVAIWKCKSQRSITDKDFQLLKYVVKERGLQKQNTNVN